MDEVDGEKPLANWQVGPRHDRAGADGEIPSTVAATVAHRPAVLDPIDILPTTAGAIGFATPESIFHEGDGSFFVGNLPIESVDPDNVLPIFLGLCPERRRCAHIYFGVVLSDDDFTVCGYACPCQQAPASPSFIRDTIQGPQLLPPPIPCAADVLNFAHTPGLVENCRKIKRYLVPVADSAGTNNAKYPEIAEHRDASALRPLHHHANGSSPRQLDRGHFAA